MNRKYEVKILDIKRFYFTVLYLLEDKKKGYGVNMNILRGDRLILVKEYDKMKMVGVTYEVANITETSVILRDIKTKIAVAALSIDIIKDYFVKTEDSKGWSPWTQIVGENGVVVAFYRTNGQKVQVRTIDNIRSKASCYRNEFNLFFGIKLAYLRCQQKQLYKNKKILQDKLEDVISSEKDISRTIEKMIKSSEK